jgi:hypothetical protein
MARTTDHRQIATHLPSLCRKLLRAMFGYRFQRHYMHGPGPAWRAKNAQLQPPSVYGKQPLDWTAGLDGLGSNRN